MRRLALVVLFAFTMTLGGCSGALDPAPSKACTAYGCKKPRNPVRELGGMVVTMILISGALAAIVRRSEK